jgi:hypothetical protein
MGENMSFWRRSWRRHPGLSAAQLACGLGLSVTGVVRIANGHSQWSSALVLAFLAGGFACWVMLVRRDEG